MNNFIAQVERPIGTPIVGIGPYGDPSGSFDKLTNVLVMVIGLLTLIAGVWFIFLLITGGIAWMSSGGDKGKLADARQRMLSGAIGLAIVVAAVFIAEIFGGLIGFPNILDPASILESISP